MWLAECSVAGLFGNVFSLPPLPLDILVVGGCYSLACLQSSRLILFSSFFSFLYFNGFHPYYYCYYYFTLVYLIGFHLMSFSVTGAHVCVVLFFLFIPSLGQGLVAGLWILLATRVVPSFRG